RRRGHAHHRRGARARRCGHRRRRPQPPSGEPRRRVPHAHRLRPSPHPRRGAGMTTTLTSRDVLAPEARDVDRHYEAGWRTTCRDALVFARRNLEHIRQIPEKLLDVTAQPLMFVLLFAYVFGGAIAVKGGNYREYLIGGILIQSLTFGLVGPATSIAT